MVVQAYLEKGQTRAIKTHGEWLEEHEAAMKRHKEFATQHEDWMKHFDAKLEALTHIMRREGGLENR
jgi:hypothetical protein